MSPALLAAAVSLAFFVAALFGSVVVFRFLKSTAQIERKDVQLGGAVAGFVVMFFLLNHFYSGLFNASREDFRLVSEAQSQPIKRMTDNGPTVISRIAAAPETQRTTAHDLKFLDRNRYYVDERAQFAMLRPNSDNWEVGEMSDYQTIGLTDVPIMRLVMSSAFADDNANLPVFGVRSKRKHEIVLDEDSSISSTALNFNLYKDPRIFANIQKNMFPELPAKEAADVQKELVAKFDSIIKSSIPVRKTLHDGVFVTMVDKATVRSAPVSMAVPRENPVEAAAVYFASAGFIPSGTTQNQVLDTDRGLASYNASVDVRNAMIDGRRGDVVVNHVGFIYDIGAKVAAITIIYIGNSPIDQYKILEAEFFSLQLGLW